MNVWHCGWRLGEPFRWPSASNEEPSSMKSNDPNPSKGADFPFVCLTTVAFTLGILSLYFSLSMRHLITL
jgi:hypothetical protein